MKVWKQKLEKKSFTEHPCVGSESWVGGNDMDYSAHYTIVWQHNNVIENKVHIADPQDATQP